MSGCHLANTFEFLTTVQHRTPKGVHDPYLNRTYKHDTPNGVQTTNRITKNQICR
jgi:hypothetical protein